MSPSSPAACFCSVALQISLACYRLPSRVCDSVEGVLIEPKVELNVELIEDIRTLSNGPCLRVFLLVFYLPGSERAFPSTCSLPSSMVRLGSISIVLPAVSDRVCQVGTGQSRVRLSSCAFVVTPV